MEWFSADRLNLLSQRYTFIGFEIDFQEKEKEWICLIPLRFFTILPN